MNGNMYRAASAGYHLEKVDTGEFSQIRGRGMAFEVRVFDAESAGRMCFMKMKGFFGLMKMETAIFSPAGIDGPLFSCDYIEAFGNQTLYLELYDTTLSHPGFEELATVKARYGYLPAHDPGAHWYDGIRLSVSDFKKGKKIREELNAYMADYTRKYFEILKGCSPCDPSEKKKKNAEYADGLLQNGGPAVDQFVKMIGKEKTAVFLKRYMFGAE